MAQTQPLSYEHKTFMDKFEHDFAIFLIEVDMFVKYLSSNYGRLGPIRIASGSRRVKNPGSHPKGANDLEGDRATLKEVNNVALLHKLRAFVEMALTSLIWQFSNGAAPQRYLRSFQKGESSGPVLVSSGSYDKNIVDWVA